MQEWFEAVEKLTREEFAEMGSRQEAPQTIFSALLDIFYLPIRHFLLKNRLFQQTRILAAHLAVNPNKPRRPR
jgi:hypothetical protein